jgi:EAL domain-containing protein (putative c-di-GMP-specific phosphodiesterase class I)
VVIGLAGSTALTFTLGGAAGAVVQTFYVPILIAARRFRSAGAVATAIASGLLAGPLRPVSDAAGSAQPVWSWVLRMGMYLVVGLLLAWFSESSRASLAAMLRDHGSAGALRRALTVGEIHAHYQPIVSLVDGHVVGFEALCRWDSPRRGSTRPAQFIPMAERTGVIVPLGRLMLTAAAGQASAWRESGYRELVVTVNVSAEQLSRPDLVADVRAVLDSAGLAPSTLCLEITETAIVRDPVAATENVRAVHALGVRIALDDFGTGHSSLAYLQDFPVDVIKIDKSFVDGVDVDAQASTLVRAIIGLAHALGATTIAEGIERPSQMEALTALGCDLGQGYLLGRPGPATQYGDPGSNGSARVARAGLRRGHV